MFISFAGGFILLGVPALNVDVVSGFAYVIGGADGTVKGESRRIAGAAFKWSAIVLGGCAALAILFGVIGTLVK